MHAILDGQPVDIEEVSVDFDAVGDNRHGEHTLMLYLSDEDLLAMGKRMKSITDEAAAEDPAYFTRDIGRDIPCPKSEREFVDDPASLALYLQNSSFWFIQGPEELMNYKSEIQAGRREIRYWIYDFRRMHVDDGVAAEFGVWYRKE